MYIKLKTLLFEEEQPEYELPMDVYGDAMEQALRLVEVMQDTSEIMSSELVNLRKHGLLDVEELKQYDMFVWLNEIQTNLSTLAIDLEKSSTNLDRFNEKRGHIYFYATCLVTSLLQFKDVEHKHHKRYVPKHYKLLLEYATELLNQVLPSLFAMTVGEWLLEMDTPEYALPSDVYGDAKEQGIRLLEAISDAVEVVAYDIGNAQFAHAKEALTTQEQAMLQATIRDVQMTVIPGCMAFLLNKGRMDKEDNPERRRFSTVIQFNKKLNDLWVFVDVLKKYYIAKLPRRNIANLDELVKELFDLSSVLSDMF